MKQALRQDPVFRLLAAAKRLARQYRALTGKPLGITGEVAEHEAARLLELKLTPARNTGYDAIRPADGRRYQIKGRCLRAGIDTSPRLGKIDIKKPFDAVLLVLMDERFDALEIYEASRRAALAAPGSAARNVRGALPVSKFKRIGRKV